LETAAVEELRASVGEVISPDDLYDQARRVWNGMT
jgi:hypothetical protein